jgi:gluconokinase
MGPCGCGKTAVGELLNQRLGGIFEDADNFHTDAAKDKMRAGTPLTDDDRWPWYDKLRARIVAYRSSTPHYILACSALKRIYRDKLRANDTSDQIVFLHLDGSFELIRDRMALRKGHYMPLSLLESQFAILERGDDLIPISIEGSPEEIVELILQHFAS